MDGRVIEREIGKYRLSLREYGEETRLAQHTHDDAFATIVVEGTLHEHSAAITSACGTHGVIVHAPGERHRNGFAGPRTRCLRVQGASFERTALLSSPSVSALALKVFREFRRPDAFSAMVLEALMLELFVIGERHELDSRTPRWLAQVRTTIDRHFQEPLTLTDLAQFADVHPGHLARAFRAHYGTTVGDTIRELRLAYARQRLASAAPLHEIARDAGFADQSHFTRTFRRALGVTPTEYRRTLTAF